MTALNNLLTEACLSVSDQIGHGKVANYIPALARVDAKHFAASIITVHGEVANFGDSQLPFSIQSISKVFALTRVLNQAGDKLWKRLHHESSGNTFNSIMQLELEQGIPRNPFINAGALVMSDILLEKQSPASCLNALMNQIRELAQDDSIEFDLEVAQSELDTDYRNASLVNFMKSFGNINHPVEDVLNVYCHHCAIAMNCEQLARSLLFLANSGIDPLSGQKIVSKLRARRINSIMMLCGNYDASGDFAFRVGVPGKSGVGGGIVTIVPNVGVIAVWSPGLDRNGNSHAGAAALEAIINKTGWGIL